MNGKKKKVTIKDIAEACGVSTATVSYVVNGRNDQRISPETWKRVLHEVHIMGYESSAVAKALATGNSGSVGLFAPNAASDPDGAQAFAAFALELIMQLEKRGYALRLIDDTCVSQTIDTLDAIIALNVDRLTFRKIGFNCFYPLICVDGIAFKPDRQLVRLTDASCRLKRTAVKARRSSTRYTPDQRLQLARQYLAQHGEMSLICYCALTGLLKDKASRELRRWEQSPHETGIRALGRGPAKRWTAADIHTEG